ncbi:MAG: hypothetical protein II499_01070, partial [Firmicutes bacterium]|nr:hypothetical protein [Bacillota bacterium]
GADPGNLKKMTVPEGRYPEVSVKKTVIQSIAYVYFEALPRSAIIRTKMKTRKGPQNKGTDPSKNTHPREMTCLRVQMAKRKTGGNIDGELLKRIVSE